MAIILMKTRYNGASFQGMVSDPTDRREATQDAFSQFGWRLRDMFWIPSTAEWLILAVGDPEMFITAVVSAMASGAFEYATCEVIATPEEFRARSAAAQNVVVKAPNRDEIDRMLMEE